MTDRAEHLERLLSERADGGLSASELAEAGRALEASADAAKAARQYGQLAKLLGGWRALPAGIDLATLGRRISESVAAQRENQAVDDLVQGWVRPLPPVDWDAFKQRVSAAVHAEARGMATAASAGPRRRMLSWVVRAAVPMAAAAAIAISVWRPWTNPQIEQAKAPSPRPEVFVSIQSPEGGGRITAKYHQTSPPPPTVAKAQEGQRGSMIAGAPKPKPKVAAELLDVMVLY